GRKSLQRNQSFELGILGEVYLAHTPFSQPLANAETSYQGSGEELWAWGRSRSWLKLCHRNPRKSGSKGRSGRLLCRGRMLRGILLLGPGVGNSRVDTRLASLQARLGAGP